MASELASSAVFNTEPSPPPPPPLLAMTTAAVLDERLRLYSKKKHGVWDPMLELIITHLIS
jgi:hypothetical protein